MHFGIVAGSTPLANGLSQTVVMFGVGNSTDSQHNAKRKYGIITATLARKLLVPELIYVAMVIYIYIFFQQRGGAGWVD